MINGTQLRKIFNDKLAKTDSLDAAFKKATWVAYNQGLKDAGGQYVREALGEAPVEVKP